MAQHLKELFQPIWWLHLTRPNEGLVSPEERRLARLLAGTLLFSTLMALFQIGAGYLLDWRHFASILHFTVPVPPLFLSLYLLSRTKRYLLAAHLFVSIGGFLLFVYSLLLGTPKLLYNLVVLMVVATVFFEHKMAWFYNIAMMGAVILLAIVYPEVLPVSHAYRLDVVDLWLFLMFSTVIFAHLNQFHRGNLQQIHLQMVASKDAARRLVESEERFAAMVENTPMPLSITRLKDGKIIYANEALRGLVGHGEQPHLGFFVKAEDRTRMLDSLDGEGQVTDFEALVRGIDGKPRWALISSRVSYLDGEPVLIGSVHDINDRKEMEQRLRESEARFNAIAEATPVPLIMFRLEDHAIIYANRSAEEIFGCSRYGLTKMSRLFPDETGIALLSTVPRKVGRVTTGELLMCKKDSTRFWVLISVNVVSFQGKPTGLCGLYDIDHRKHMEQRLRQKRDFLAALHQVSLGLLNRLDLNNLLENIAEQGRQILHVQHGDIHLISKDGSYIEQIGRDDQGVPIRFKLERGQGIVGRTWQAGRTIVVADYLTWEQRIPYGPYQGLHATMCAPLIVAGEVVGTLSMATNKPERQFAEEEVIQLEQLAQLASVALDNARLYHLAEEGRALAEAGNKAKSTFLANMSHELRTPLNAILGFTQLLQRQLNGEARRNLDVIMASGEHLLGLINSILELSKIESGRASLEEHSFELHDLLDGVERMFSLKAEERGVSLRLERDLRLPRHIVADEGKLRQVLINLMGNAVKFTTEGRVVLSVFAEWANDKLYLTFMVQDTGPGIQPDEVPHLFEVFGQTARGRREAEGSGLGLPISRQYVTMMGGQITVDSEPGSGSCFSFRIPVQPVEEHATSEPIQGHNVIGIQDGGEWRLVVAEDDHESRRLLMELLEPIGFKIRGVRDGIAARAVCTSWKPHLIWMDIRMPRMDGYEATRQIKRDMGEQAPIIVALTANAFEEDRNRMLASGCDDFIRKPYRIEELFQCLERNLGIAFIHGPDQAKQTHNLILSPQSRAEVDEDTLAQLYQAALLADVEATEEILDRMQRRHPDLARHLRGLAANYRFDELIAFAEGQPTKTP